MIQAVLIITIGSIALWFLAVINSFRNRNTGDDEYLTERNKH